MSFANRDGVIWFDGELVPWREATVHVLTHSLHYGMGVFEGVRAYRGERGTAVFRLGDHTRRLFRSAHILGMRIPYDQDGLNRAQLDVVRENGLESAYIRPIAFYGSRAMGLRPDMDDVRVAVTAWEWGTYLGDEGLERGIRVCTSSFARLHVNVAMCRAKATGHYINSTLALNEAVANGYDEAVMLDTDGYVMEGSGENLFIVRDGIIQTPDLTSALEGVTRATVFTLAAEAGIEIVEKRITRDEVYVADEAFFTGTAAEVAPIREMDNRTIGAGRRGPVTERIQTMFFDQVLGRREKHGDWLTPV